MKTHLQIFVCMVLLNLYGCRHNAENLLTGLSGPYLGQNLPGESPELFAPGIVNIGLFTRDMAMSPDGNSLYFRMDHPLFVRSVIIESHLISGKWTEPEIASFSRDPRWRCLEPCISPDGREFYFVSDRPMDTSSVEPGPFGIWVMEWLKGGWSNAQRLDSTINGADGTFFPSVTRDGTLYFCRNGVDGRGEIWRARKDSIGIFSPEKLPDKVNAGTNRYNAFIDPDESYLILPIAGLEDSQGGFDYYILSRSPDDTWSEPVHLGQDINSPALYETSAFVSRDSKYLFFSSNRIMNNVFSPEEELTLEKFRKLAVQPGANGDMAIYWKSAEFIKRISTDFYN